MDLERALVQTLRMGGLALLGQPHKLLSHVMDLCNETSQEMQVFRNNCEQKLCAPFFEVSHMLSPSVSDLMVASQRAELYLMDERMIDEEAAHRTACCIACAVGCVLGMPAAELDSLRPNGQAGQTQGIPAQQNMSPAVTTAVSTSAFTQSSPQPGAVSAPAEAPAQATHPQSQKKKSAAPAIVGGIVAIAVIAAVALFVLGNNGKGAGASASTSSGSVKAQTSTSSNTVSVPATKGLTLDSARVNLESAGLRVSVSEEYSDETPQTVLSSDPAEGTQASEGSTVKLLVAKARPHEETTTQPSSSSQETQEAQPSQPSESAASSGYGPASFASTSGMAEVWDFFEYFDRTPQTIHNWMLDNNFWLDYYGEGCAVYLSEYGTQFVFEQSTVSPESTPGYTKATSNDQSPLLTGMKWRVMRVHFWGESLDYIIDKCHLSGESWRGSADGLSSGVAGSYIMVPADAPAAKGSRGGYLWDAAYDGGSRFGTVVVRVG